MTTFDPTFFNENGYMLFKGVFSEKECAIFKECLLAEIEKGKEALRLEQETNTPHPFNRGKIADTPRGIHKGMLQDITHRNDIFMTLARDKRLAECVAPFLGENLVMFRSLSVFKPADYTAPVGWHQDMIYWQGGAEKITLWVSLDTVTDENGALHVIPGTHKALIKDVEKQNEIFSYVLPEKYVDHGKEVIVDTDIGDVVIFHSQTFHMSRANESGGDRYALIFTFQPASDQSHHRDGPPMLVAGQNVT